MGEERCVGFGPLAKRTWSSVGDPFDFARRCEVLCEHCRSGADGTKSEPESKKEPGTVDGWTVHYECNGRFGQHEYKCTLLVIKMVPFEGQQPAEAGQPTAASQGG